MAFDSQNSQAATAAILELLGNPSDVNPCELQSEIGQFMLKYGDGLPGSTSAALFGELIDIVVDFGFPMPASVVTAFRGISTLEESSTLLDPELNQRSLVTHNGKTLLHEIGGLGVDRHELALYTAATAPQIAELPGQISRIAGHLQDGTLDANTSGLNISIIKYLLVSTVDQFIQVIVSTALILGGVLLKAADFGPTAGTRAQTLHLLRGTGAAGRKRHRRTGIDTCPAATDGLGQAEVGVALPLQYSRDDGARRRPVPRRRFI